MAQPTQEVCTPVAAEVGAPPDQDLIGDPAFREELREVTEHVQATHGRSQQELDDGTAAKRALATLGCNACMLSGVCVVKADLESHVATGEENAEIESKLVMLTSAPKWLSAARLNQSGVNTASLQQALATPESTDQALKSGELDLDALLCDTTNQFEGLYTKDDLPELNKITALSSDQRLEAHEITTRHGDRFSVIDASEQVGFKGEPLKAAEYGVLSGKVLGRMTELDDTGKPQILTPDFTMQKPITRMGGDEIRMGGKNRIYVVVAAHPADNPELTARITILGSHGGDASTQRNFIDTAVR